MGSVSSIPQSADVRCVHRPDPTLRGGEAEPTRSARLIKDPELRAAFLRAYHAWERTAN